MQAIPHAYTPRPVAITPAIAALAARFEAFGLPPVAAMVAAGQAAFRPACSRDVRTSH